jgi:membrane protein DedA with SNARE-associated domain
LARSSVKTPWIRAKLGDIRAGIDVALVQGMNGIAAQVAHHGLGLVFANVLLQQVGVPIPAEPTLVVAGSLAAKSLMSRTGLVLVTVAAATLADVSWFLLGRRFGPAVLRIVARMSATAGRLSRREDGTFARWGLRSLVVAKFLPGVSQVIVPMSGATGVAFRTFIFYDLLGTLVWLAVPIGSGMIFHEQVDGVLSAMSSVGIWLLLGAGAVGVALLARRYLNRGRRGVEVVSP